MLQKALVSRSDFFFLFFPSARISGSACTQGGWLQCLLLGILGEAIICSLRWHALGSWVSWPGKPCFECTSCRCFSSGIFTSAPGPWQWQARAYAMESSPTSWCIHCGATFASILWHPTTYGCLKKVVQCQQGAFLRACCCFHMWFFLILCFSCLSILDQTSKSVPNFLGLRGDWLWLLSICIGGISSCVKYLLSYLGSQAGWPSTHAPSPLWPACLWAVSSLPQSLSAWMWDASEAGRFSGTNAETIASPSQVDIMLDLPPANYKEYPVSGHALGCRPNRQRFQIQPSSDLKSQRFESLVSRRFCWGFRWRPAISNELTSLWFRFAIWASKVLRHRDICKPTSPSVSTCASTALLRLQDVWLSKFISSALAVPAVKVMASQYITDSSEIVGHFAMLFAFAIMTSGHLPLVMPFLYVSALSQTVLATISWAKSSMKHRRVRDPERERERDSADVSG